MKSRSKKSDELKQIKQKLPKSKMVVFTTFSRSGEKGLSVSQMTELKRILRSLSSEYVVIKKSLMNLAMKGLNPPAGGDRINIFEVDGSVGLALGGDDPYAIAKKLYEFSRKNQSLKFFGAFMDGTFVGSDRFMEIAKMPSKEVLIGRLLGMLTYPIRGLAIALNEVSKQKSN